MKAGWEAIGNLVKNGPQEVPKKNHITHRLILEKIKFRITY